jgi:DNA-binding response OmpR family regulator
VSKKRILTVDDDPTMQEFLRINLEPEGYTVVPMPNGPAALDWLATEVPDLVLLDVEMPGLSGFDVCRRIRWDVARYTPVIFLTGKDRPEEVVEGRAAGADLYLLKPVRRNRLLAAVAMFLS